MESASAAEVLNQFGGDLARSARGGNRDAAELHNADPGRLPTLWVLDLGDRCLTVELFSSEALRVPILRRLAGNSRMLSVGVNDNAERRLAYADKNGPIGPFPAPVRTMPEWSQLDQVADRAGLSLDGWSDDHVPASSIEFLSQVCGRPVDDEIMGEAGLVGVILPVLPHAFAKDGPVRSQAEARLTALADSASAEQLRPVIAWQVQGMLREAQVDSDAIRSAIDEAGESATEVADESPAGHAVRELIAERYLLLASAVAAWPSRGSRRAQPDPGLVRGRVSAGVVAAALLRGGPRAALLEMLHRRTGAAWQQDLIDDLAAVTPAPAAAGTASERLEEHHGRRARSQEVPQAWFADRDDEGATSARSVPLDEIRIAPQTFLRETDG
ncbi:hypothetical protein [Amycolatopsis lurida]|uniref:hypothetical protein n=1 Tax=Amycolatopsis lurida TaxID=31959 RepID=UPI0036519192